MRTTLENHPSDESTDKQPGGSSFEESEDLIAFAQGYFSSDFPNPDRVGCPTSGSLSALMRSGQLPGDELRVHLFSCSECFREYRNAMAAHRDLASTETISWWDELAIAFTDKSRLIFVGLTASLILSIAIAYIWIARKEIAAPSVVSNGSEPSGATPQSTSKDSAASVAESDTSPAPVAQPEQASPRQRRRPARQKPHELIAQAIKEIDLAEYSALSRGTGRGGVREEKIIKLSGSVTRLLFTLPEDSVRGLYNISIVDAYHRPLVTMEARSMDGRTLTTILDMRGLSEKKYQL